MPHSDSSVLTVLHQDMTPGLEVLKDGAWVPISPTRDVVVIYIGDHMQVCQHLDLQVAIQLQTLD
jgi:isopenicillin N synthase-like dioxygenase